ncbi:ROK family protein [Microbacterium sp. No. 7]|uniref:ROK family protein n=1 Tax=Microbacterium sp. No. 7 TaxID=1714373 RepID=UPI0006D132E3|nr:ROK family protein [Microbacterium sp. No. 7]ALJ22153.1 transcriptional regulator [Microbacterium sp. No. 7]
MTTVPAGKSTRPPSLDAVFAHAWAAGGFTAADAMASTGLTRSTTIEAMDTLVELGLLRELPNARAVGDYRKGRPARRFELREDAGVLVGVDAGHAHLTAVVTDLRSQRLGIRRTTRQVDRDDAADRRAAIADLVDDALRAAGRTRADVLALCVGVPAPVDESGRSPHHRHLFWDRMNPGLADVFRAWAPLVRVDNDASLAAVAEGSVGAAVGCRSYIALLAGERLGSGVVIDGNLLRGAHGGVGEMVAFDHVEGVGTARGLGTRAAEWALEAIERGDVTGPLAAIPRDRLDGQAVIELASQGDPDAQRIVHRVGVVLARIVATLGSMFDPERVVVTGAIAAGVAEVVAAAREALPTGMDLPAPDLAISQLGADVVVTGAVAAAAALARDRLLDVWTRPAA